MHARGARPYTFGGEIDLWHAPGAWVKYGVTRCAIDAAWIVQHVLGVPPKGSPAGMGVPYARERAMALAA